MFSLYIIKSINKDYNYLGVTNNLERRLKDHNAGINKSTKPYKPFLLACKGEYKTLSEARKREWFFKCTPEGGKLKRKILNIAGVAAPDGA